MRCWVLPLHILAVDFACDFRCLWKPLYLFFKQKSRLRAFVRSSCLLVFRQGRPFLLVLSYTKLDTRTQGFVPIRSYLLESYLPSAFQPRSESRCGTMHQTTAAAAAAAAAAADTSEWSHTIKLGLYSSPDLACFRI